MQVTGFLSGEPLVLPLAPPVGYVKVIPAGEALAGADSGPFTPIYNSQLVNTG
jgi:hypothetical protein